MKRYKLLKDLPFAKAGTVFTRNTFKSKDGLSDYDYLETSILLDGDQDETAFGIKRNYFVNNFDDWFEEIKEPEQYYSINILKATVEKVMKTHYSEWAVENLKSLGLLFENREEAEKYLEYLKAKVVIKQDAKGFKPDWNNKDEYKYWGYWNFSENGFDYRCDYDGKPTGIVFRSIKDIKESFKKHPEEWKTYLTYEQ